MILLIPQYLSIFGYAMKNDQLHKIVLSIGSNQGDRVRNLGEACRQIELRLGKAILISSIYETEPWGFEAPDSFLNQALMIASAMGPGEVLKTVQKIEEEMGRTHRLNFYTSRIIDIDIIFYDHLLIKQPDLIIPHPLMQLRKFVLIPLNEIIPEFIHPVIKASIAQILDQCEDTLKVELLLANEV